MSSLSEARDPRARSRVASAEEVEGASGRGTRPEPRVSKPDEDSTRARSRVASAEEVEGASGRGTRPERLATPELRTGVWTRFGASSVLGDAVTEDTLATLAESAHRAAQSQGYAVGWADGQRAAREAARARAEAEQARALAVEAERDREHQDAVTALRLAAARLHEAVAAVAATVEDQATGLAWELTQELVGRELPSVTGPDVVRRALQLAPTERIVRLHLHPDHLADLAADDLADLDDRGISVAADPALAWGDALVEAETQVIDLRFRTALERVREVLS